MEMGFQWEMEGNRGIHGVTVALKYNQLYFLSGVQLHQLYILNCIWNTETKPSCFILKHVCVMYLQSHSTVFKEHTLLNSMEHLTVLFIFSQVAPWKMVWNMCSHCKWTWNIVATASLSTVKGRKVRTIPGARKNLEHSWIRLVWGPDITCFHGAQNLQRCPCPSESKCLMNSHWNMLTDSLFL